MKKCTSCRKAFNWQALSAVSGDGHFCSMNCLPEGELDEPYALEYFYLVNSCNTIPIITSMSQQHDLLAEIDFLLIQYEEYLLGDLENSYYKHEIRQLLPQVFEAKVEIEMYFTKKEKVLFDKGLFIGWDNMRMALSEEVAVNLQDILQEQVDSFESQPLILYNQSLNAVTEWQNILYYERPTSAEDQKLHSNIEALHDVAYKFLEPFIQEGQLDAQLLLDYVTLALCPICGIMEPWEDFTYLVVKNVQACWSCA